MKLAEIEQEWKEDSKVEKSRLQDHMFAVDHLVCKYQSILLREEQTLVKRKTEQGRVYYKLREYYKGTSEKADLELLQRTQWQGHVLKGDIDKVIDTDELYMAAVERTENQNIKVNYIRGILRQLHNRGYSLKTIFEYLKWSEGISNSSSLSGVSS